MSILRQQKRIDFQEKLKKLNRIKPHGRPSRIIDMRKTVQDRLSKAADGELRSCKVEDFQEYPDLGIDWIGIYMC